MNISSIKIPFSFSQLPQDVKFEVMDHLDIPSLLNFSRVSKGCNKGCARKIVLVRARELANEIEYIPNKIEILLEIAKIDMFAARKILAKVVDMASNNIKGLLDAGDLLKESSEKTKVLDRAIALAHQEKDPHAKVMMLFAIADFEAKFQIGNAAHTFLLAYDLISQVPNSRKVKTYAIAALGAYVYVETVKAKQIMTCAIEIAQQDKEELYYLSHLTFLSYWDNLEIKLPLSDLSKADLRKFDTLTLKGAESKINEIKTPEEKVRFLLNIARYHFYYGDQKECERITNLVYQIIGEIEDFCTRLDAVFDRFCPFLVEIEDMERIEKVLNLEEDRLSTTENNDRFNYAHRILMASIKNNSRIDIHDALKYFETYNSDANYEWRYEDLLREIVKVKCENRDLKNIETFIDQIQKTNNRKSAFQSWIEALIKDKKVDEAVQVFTEKYLPILDHSFPPMYAVWTRLAVACAKNYDMPMALELTKQIKNPNNQALTLVQLAKFLPN